MPLSPEELYLQLGNLVMEMPDLAHCPITPEVNRWLGRASALVEEAGLDVVPLQVAWENLSGPLREMNAGTITSAVYHALAKVELIAPARVQGSFIAAGNTLDAYAAVGRVLGIAKTDVLLVDPSADEKIVTEYALLAPESVAVQILADAADYKKTLKPAAERWSQQFGKARAPLEVRLAPRKTLHDRLIIVDNADVWGVGQSFNKLAERAHTSLVRMDPETGILKIAAYLEIWQRATVL
jgi:pimeloyl-ACP methyl ester carboxylesterase